MSIDSPSRQEFLKNRRLWREYLNEEREIFTISAASIPELITSIDEMMLVIYQNELLKIEKLLLELSTKPLDLSIVFCNPIEGHSYDYTSIKKRDTISQGFNPFYQDGMWRQSVRVHIPYENHHNPKPKSKK